MVREYFDTYLLKPEMAQVHLAFLELFTSRLRQLETFREAGIESISIMDSLVCLHVAVFFMVRGEGTREKSIVASLQAPRRTIRDSLNHGVTAGLLYRDPHKFYFPTSTLAQIVNINYRENRPEMQRFVDAWTRMA